MRDGLLQWIAIALCCACGVRAPPVESTTVVVVAHRPATTPGPADGSDARPFQTLGEALRAAPANAVIRLGEGTWRESVILTRPVLIVGRGAARTVLQNPEGAPGVLVRGADRVQLRSLAIEGGPVGVRFEGGTGHLLLDVAVRQQSVAGIEAVGAQLVFRGGRVLDVGDASAGRGIDARGGELTLERVELRRAGRRAVVVDGGKATLIDLEQSGSAVSAVQATDGAAVRVVRGTFLENGGAALYAGAAQLDAEGVVIEGGEFAAMGARGATLDVRGLQARGQANAAVASVNADAVIARSVIRNHGTDAAIAVVGRGKRPVEILDNELRVLGPVGVHANQAAVFARGNVIIGAQRDKQHDFGDAVLAVESDLILTGNVLRWNQGSGVDSISSEVSLTDNALLDNGAAGVRLSAQSKLRADANRFAGNQRAGVEASEGSKAKLRRNQFGASPGYDVDAKCLGGTVDVQDGNRFAARRERTCEEAGAAQ